MKVELIHFPLHPDTPDSGLTLEELFRGRDYDIDGNFQRMKTLTEAEGLEYGKRTHTYNSRKAQEIGKWADDQLNHGNDYQEIHMGLYRAYFVEGLNIGDDQVLLDIASQCGLPVDEVSEVLKSRSYSEAIDKDWEKSRSYGVTGVPTFVYKGRGVVGAQPYEMLEQLVKES